jgi:predicted small metal-binding protein
VARTEPRAREHARRRWTAGGADRAPGRGSTHGVMEKERTMLELRCGDVVYGCDGVVTGDDQDEVLGKAATHAADAHGLTDIDEPTRAALVGAIHPV